MSEQQNVQQELPAYRTPVKQLIRQIVVLLLTIFTTLLTGYANIIITAMNQRIENLNTKINYNYTKGFN